MLKKLGIVFIILGALLITVAAYFGLIKKNLMPSVQIFMIISGYPLLNLGIAFQYISRPLEKRKKPALVLFVIALFLLGFGSISKYFFHAPGSNIELLTGGYLFCFGFIPIYSKNRFDKWSLYVGSRKLALGLTLTDMFSIILVMLGLLFKVMHWPGATLMFTLGGIALAVNFLGWNRILGQQLVLRKKAEERLEVAHEEIMDSIAYAKRIQTAILPPDRVIKEYLPESFVLYKPKDVVAGDFYWMENVGDTILFAAADCTGHGVPGAMVSVICNSALNRSVREFELSDPGKILTKAREIIIKEFEKSEEDVKDGMDISLCAYNPKELTLKFAGAHNPLWLLRNNEIIETKGDKQPVGKFEQLIPFKTHQIEIQKGDLFYVFSDGYVDQFGGERGKKFKAKALRNLLLKIQDEGLLEQKKQIDQTFENWKGSLEQVDDVCVIGVRV